MSSPYKPSTKHTLLPSSNVDNLIARDSQSQRSFDNLIQEAQDEQLRGQQQSKYAVLNRMPTLYEVLNRRTDPPVDLWSFYVYMRDYQNAVDYLDFWIDCITHLRLCKDYVKGLRESLILSERHKCSSDEKHKSTSSEKEDPNRESISSSLLLEALLNEGLLDDKDNKRVSSFLQGNEYISTSDPRISAIFQQAEQDDIKESSLSQQQQAPTTPQSPSKDYYEPLSSPQKVFAGDIQQRVVSSNSFKDSPKRQSARLIPEQLEKYIANVKSGTITRATLKSSSRNILNTYFQENSPKRLIIPDRIIRKIKHDVELQGRDDPDVFEDAKNYVYSAMERDAFPSFIEKNGLHNLNNQSCLIRLIVGLFSLFAGFWIAYCLIFIDIEPKAIRAVLIAPFLIGCYLLGTFFYKLDPIMVFFGLSDNPELSKTRNTKTSKIIKNIREPFVKSLLWKRAIWLLFLICIAAAILSILFGLVPGRRI